MISQKILKQSERKWNIGPTRRHRPHTTTEDEREIGPHPPFPHDFPWKVIRWLRSEREWRHESRAGANMAHQSVLAPYYPLKPIWGIVEEENLSHSR